MSRSDQTSNQIYAVERHVMLVDGHVHLYPCFDAGLLFDAALANFARAAARRGARAGQWIGCLCLTETATDHEFRRIAASEHVGRWRVRPTAEQQTIRLESSDGSLLVVAGCQVATRDGMEVLGIGIIDRVDDRLTLDDTLARVRQSGAVPIVPWAFGKWMLARGRHLRRLVERSAPSDFALADNGGRPALGIYPPILKLGRERGFAILSGSDPLPFPQQVRRVGQVGFIMSDAQESAPFASIKSLLRSPRASVEPYGAFSGLPQFVAAQARMHMRSRLRGNAHSIQDGDSR